ncbi:hypothetical protein [Nannocystis punicea]|uniref:DUF4157 domain-containing protein n=1 Tax=Nannocystis punicea TaxID=2995304 RepID=A0ABY7GS18_9BACT|nr:hypothetical protein [Nannocystis poenicansa]WAS89735.1 hypothetical protein O0S08_26380 [Nannocystis poenicansa]
MRSARLSRLVSLGPAAVRWAEAHEAEILRTGLPLDAKMQAVARAVGVRQPERVRLAVVARIPLPEDPDLRQAALSLGMLGPETIGLTLGHGIYVRKRPVSTRLLSHECRHVYQYEQAGSIAAFLADYLQQIATVGYLHAPLEVDARAHEIERL